MALTVAIQIVLVVLLVAASMARGETFDPDSIERLTGGFFMSPVGFMVAAGTGQLAFITCVLVATWRSSGHRMERLGLRRPRLPWSAYVVFVAGQVEDDRENEQEVALDGAAPRVPNRSTGS
jgi:hypothetical protein